MRVGATKHGGAASQARGARAPDPPRGARAPASWYTPAEVEAAIERLADAESFANAERLVSSAVPGLHRVLAEALGAGGWFGESHESELLKAATNPDPDERLTAVRTLLAEETRLGMMVGVAVGWSLRDELESARTADKDAADDHPDSAGDDAAPEPNDNERRQ